MKWFLIAASLSSLVGCTGAFTWIEASFEEPNLAPSQALKIIEPSEMQLAQVGVTITGTCEPDLAIDFTGDLSIPATTPCHGGHFTTSISFSAGDGPKNVVLTQAQADGTSLTTQRKFMQGSPSSGTLMWSPPSLENPITLTLLTSTSTSTIYLDNTKDYILSCDPANDGKIVRKIIRISGGRNLVMKGCHVQRQLNTPVSTYPPSDPGTNLICPNVANPIGTMIVTGQTGIAYFEGLVLDLQNSTSDYNNYGVDGIDVGSTVATGTLTIEGTMTEGDVVTLTFSNPYAVSKGTLTGFPYSLSYTVTNSDTLATAATNIMNLINADPVLSDVTVALEASQLNNALSPGSLTLSQPLPSGGTALVSATYSAYSNLAVTFGHADGALKPVSYVFQNVRIENAWGTTCGRHADAIQIQGDMNKLYMDHVTMTSGYQVVQLQPEFGINDGQFFNINAIYLDSDYSHKVANGTGHSLGANGYAWWLGTGATSVSTTNLHYNVNMHNVFADNRTNFNGAWYSSSVSPTRSSSYPSFAVGGDNTKAQFSPQPNRSITGFVSTWLVGMGDYVSKNTIVDGLGRVTYIPVTSFANPSPAP